MGAFPVTVKMVKTTIFLVLLSLLYQAHAAPQDAAAAENELETTVEPAAADAAAEPAKPLKLRKKAMEVLDKTDTVIVAKLTALADCPSKIGTAAELLQQISAAMISCKTAADADVTEVLTSLRERNCKKFKRTLLALMVNKKVVDAATTCQEEMVKIVDKDDGAADAAAEPAAEAAAETATEAPAA